ncbi:unnamed protein product [Nesidiocoris tenuis]|uniref:Uncharacterized protein n=1 Tax=Nesidiocoris tenuis TaxID=355587 RepID=A0A6H5G773_9HEMI|nr:unnamed protein product [Nesidiocoris tenuis]
MFFNNICARGVFRLAHEVFRLAHEVFRLAQGWFAIGARRQTSAAPVQPTLLAMPSRPFIPGRRLLEPTAVRRLGLRRAEPAIPHRPRPLERRAVEAVVENRADGDGSQGEGQSGRRAGQSRRRGQGAQARRQEDVEAEDRRRDRPLLPRVPPPLHRHQRVPQIALAGPHGQTADEEGKQIGEYKFFVFGQFFRILLKDFSSSYL